MSLLGRDRNGARTWQAPISSLAVTVSRWNMPLMTCATARNMYRSARSTITSHSPQIVATHSLLTQYAPRQGFRGNPERQPPHHSRCRLRLRIIVETVCPGK